MFGRVFVEQCHDVHALTMEHHVLIARGEIRMTRQNHLTMSDFDNGDWRRCGQALGEHLGEQRRHMLHDDDRNRQRRRKLMQQNAKGIGASRRGSDGEDLDGG